MIVDRVILRLYTAAAHAIQRWTGRTCFFLAALCAAALMLSWLLRIFLYWAPQLVPHAPAQAFYAWCAPFVMASWLLEMAAASRANDAVGGSTLPSRILWWRGRFWQINRLIVVLVAVPLTTICAFPPRGPLVTEVIFHWHDLMLASFLYLCAVDPLPPCRGTVREWLSKLAAVRRPISLES